MANCCFPKNLALRQIQDNFRIPFQRKSHVTKNLLQRLRLDEELEGHSSCVNCLQFNEKGDLLASGSDDLNIIIWSPHLGKQLHTIQSGHNGNIFSVNFVPGTDDQYIVSGAADSKIKVNNYIKDEVTFSCSCHGARVKRIATTPNDPQMFWSASEDGLVMQFDLRAPHRCSHICSNVLVNLVNHIGRNAEAKCLAINPIYSDLIAVGANDPFIRLYDRRMLRTMTARFPTEPPPLGAEPHHGPIPNRGADNLTSTNVSYFVAGHLPMKYDDYQRRHRSLSATYVTFSPDGKDLLANLGGEQIYLFNVISKRKPLYLDMQAKAAYFLSCKCPGQKSSGINQTHLPGCFGDGRNIPWRDARQDSSTRGVEENLPEKVEAIKVVANYAYRDGNYDSAIIYYSQCIAMYKNAASLYANRAAAFLKRAWEGDYYAALRDCYSALEIDEGYLKAHYRMIQCLHKLDWIPEAHNCMQTFRKKFPNYRAPSTFTDLEREIRLDMFKHLTNEGQTQSINITTYGSYLNRNDRISFGVQHSDMSELEKQYRKTAYDYEYRFCGHCNTTTDIKEANFFGDYGEFIIAGSDDGVIFIWERETGETIKVLRGDDSIVNCLQPHPVTCMLATSGIDPVVRLWRPTADDGSTDDREVSDQHDVAVANQRRMTADPIEMLLMNLGFDVYPGFLQDLGIPDDYLATIECSTS